MWCLAVGDFAECPETVRIEVRGHPFELRAHVSGVGSDSQRGRNPRADEPAPNGSLMVGSVALVRRAAVCGTKFRIVVDEAPQPVRCEEPVSAERDDGTLSFKFESAVLERNREKGIGTQARVVATRSVENVETVVAFGIPIACESAARDGRHRGEVVER